LRFINDIAGEPPRSLLDIACGTGSYSIKLAKKGFDITAVDLDAAMIEQLSEKVKKKNLNIKFITSNMLELKDKLYGSLYDLAFCIGNSVVHLSSKEDILKFLYSTKQLVKKNGNIIIQIINFDRVILSNINSLPPITNQEIGLEFKRFYRYDKENNLVFFRTVLSVDNKTIENEIQLYPLLSEDLLNMLKEVGYKNISFFGDFNRNEFDKLNSFMLVLNAQS
ncbi:MAG: methyltransferase domain-containing protein, partial [Bacillota bacterium]|nr:methyltransferase domain-containing protein [Bacillota bacterium]